MVGKNFKVPSSLLMKVLSFKAFSHKNGILTLWDIPANLSPNYVTVYSYKLFEKLEGNKKTRNFYYNIGKLQGKQSFRILSERFGYAKTIQDKKKLLDFQLQQGIVAGHGDFNITRADFVNNIFIIKGIRSPFAEEYKRFFGKGEYVDDFLRGVANSFIEEVVSEKMFCVETQCIANGDNFCEFKIQPLDKWEKNKDKKYILQQVKIYPDLKELGSKIKPYLQI